VKQDPQTFRTLYMICFSHGGMIGRIGPFIWFNGADLYYDDHRNTIETGGLCRFGSVSWCPPGEPSTDWILNFFKLS
jgi:hypothetical protein